MRPKRLISLLVAVCMMITMLPLSAVTAFAADTASSTEQEISVGDYKYAYTVNADGSTATITEFRGPVDPKNTGPYDIDIPEKLGNYTVTVLGEDSFSTDDFDSPLYDIHHTKIQSVTIPQCVTSIGEAAFAQCRALQSLTIDDAAISIGDWAFDECLKLTTLSLGKKITTIGDDAFRSCYKLETIMLPAGLTSFGNCLIGCPAGRKWDYHGNPINPIGAIYYNNDWDHAKELPGYNVLKNRNFLYLCKVTFDAKGGSLTGYDEVPVYKTEKITDTKANELTAINDPTRAGYKFTGWYTTADGKPEDGKFDVNNTAITDDITLYAGWKFDPNAPGCHPLTVTGGTVTVKYDGSDVTSKLNSKTDAATGKKTYSVPDGATVTVTLDKNLIPEGMVFDIWSTGKFSLPLGQDYKAESITFTMNSDVDIAAQSRDATIEDDEPDIVGPIVIGTTVVVGGAVLGYQAYSLGAEFAGKLMALPYFPSNRSALAMMLWEDAGKPMPESEILYPDVGQEEQDMDLQHAARWAMEHDLLPDLNDQDAELPPEQVKFYPDNMVTKISVLRAWKKAQDLKQNAQ